MTDQVFSQLSELANSDGPAAAIDRLIETLRERKDYHKLFDALCLKAKFDMGLPLVQPTGFDDVPDDQREAFEVRYIDAAREVGESLLEAQKIPQAWIYLRTIREPQKVRDALEALDSRREADEETEELINIALYEGAHPVKGLEMMLRTHGTCNTITSMDQQAAQLSPEDRRRAAALLVRELYDDLCHTVQQEVQQRLALAPPGDDLRELITGRDWLFEEGNYHVDVSHLNAVVRFARFLDGADPELTLAVQLAEYGSKLDNQFQYPGDPPFDDFYPAHIHYFNALMDEGREEGVQYFRDKLDAEPDEEDKPLLAFVLTDLMTRCGGMTDEVMEVAERYLSNIDDPSFSFARLCLESGRLDRLQKTAEEKGDLVGYLAALVQTEAEAVSS